MNQCEFCGVVESEEIYVKYRSYFKLCLCDRCVDKLLSVANGRNVDEFWEEESASKFGYPDFPYHKVGAVIKNVN